MLVISEVTKDFGGLRAVDGVSMTVERGSITGLIGPNGAGKTTLFNIVAGVLRPTAGRIDFKGVRVDGQPPHRLFRAGLARTFQIPKPVYAMTVLENMMLAPLGQRGERFWETWYRGATIRAQERANRDKARALLDFLGLTRLADERADTLSGGQLKLLELGRALMADPEMLLLDEPGAGVNPTLLGHIVDRIAELNRRGITFLIIEHNMALVTALCHPVVCMANGAVLARGSAEEVRRDPRVLEAYLGGVAA